MSTYSIFWAISLSLFIGAIGFPIPENPVLMGGGYAIFTQMSPPLISIVFWFLAILLGDCILFAISHWFFTRPKLAAFLKRTFSEKRLLSYQESFDSLGGWTLFLARFTYGIRAVAYIAAGAARYPWKKFLLVDGFSVAIQVAIFVGIGYFAGEKVEWAQATSEKIVLLLAVIAFASILITWAASVFMRRLSKRKRARLKERPESASEDSGSHVNYS